MEGEARWIGRRGLCILCVELKILNNVKFNGKKLEKVTTSSFSVTERKYKFHFQDGLIIDSWKDLARQGPADGSSAAANRATNTLGQRPTRSSTRGQENRSA